MTVRAGVIGVGIMGAEHARLLAHVLSGSQVAAVFDVDPGRAASVAQACGSRVIDDPMVLIKDDDVDCVLIASTDSTHEQFVLAAVAAGKSVLCEKPLAPEADGCERIMAAEAEQGERLVDVGFMRRFDPGFTALRSDVCDGRVGQALLVHCVHRNASSPGATSASVITGSAVHEFDTVRWLLDDEPESVTVHTPRPSSRSAGVQDPVVVVLRMASGALADVEVFVNAGYGYDVRCEVVGEDGAVLLDTPAGTVRRSAGVVGRGIAADWRARFGEAYRIELQAWVDAVATGRPSGLATAWDGYVATATATAAVRALTTGRTTPVELTGRTALYR